MDKKFKKRLPALMLSLVIGVGAFSAVSLAACDNNSNVTEPPANSQTEYYVSFDMQTHGVQIPEAQTSGGKVTKPTDPTAKGYEFGGWYTDKACTAGKEFDFNTAVTSDVTLYAKWTEAEPEPVAANTYYLVVGTAGNYSVAQNVVLTETDGVYSLKVSGQSITPTTVPNADGQGGTAYNFKDALGAGKDLDCIFMSMNGMLQGYGQSGVACVFIQGTTLDGVQVPNGYSLEYGTPVAANTYYLVVGTAGNYSVATNVVLTGKDDEYSLKVNGQSITPALEPNKGAQGQTGYVFPNALGEGVDIDCVFMEMGGLLQCYGDLGGGNIGVKYVFTPDTTVPAQMPQGYTLEYTATQPVASNDYYLVIGTAGSYSLAQNVVLTETDGAYSLKVSGQSITATTTPNADGNGGTAYNFKDALGAGKDLDGIIMSMGGVLQGYGQAGLAFVFVKTLDGVQVPNGYALAYTVPAE